MSDKVFLDPQGRRIGIVEGEVSSYAHTAMKVSLVDANLMSGSSDRLRTSCGGYFTNTKNADDLYDTPPPFTKFMPLDNSNPDILNVNSHYGPSVDASVLLNREIEADRGVAAMGYTTVNNFGEQVGAAYQDQQQTILPSVTFVCRIEGDPTANYLSDVLQGSKYWKTLFMGGQFEHHNIAPVYNEAAYDDHYITTELPYNNLQRNYLFKGASLTNVVGVVPRYNRYWQRYQAYYSRVQASELNIPSWYAINLMGYVIDQAELLNPSDANGAIVGLETLEQRALKLFDYSMLDYYMCGGYIPDVTKMRSIISPGNEGQVVELTTPDVMPTIDQPDAPQMKYVKQYINDTLPAKTATLSPNTMSRMRNRNKNVIFNSKASTEQLSEYSEASQNSAAFPYYVMVQFPGLNRGQISSAIEAREASSIFMRTLKESFNNQTDNKVHLIKKQFLKNMQFISSSVDRGQNQTTSTTEMVSYRTVDLVKMLLYAYDNVLLTHDDFCFMDYQTLEVKAAEDTKGLYRAYNSRNTSLLLADILQLLGGPQSAVPVNNLNAVLNSQIDAGPATLQEQARLIPESKYHEVVAYRVEKVGGPPQSDSMTQDVLQNFWIFNTHPGKSPSQILLDSQVKYGSKYTYKVYAYYAINGFKYQYSGLQLSRLIGQIREDGYTGPLEYASGIEGGEPTPPKAYCIEYYDPFTNTTTPDVMKNVSAVYGLAAGMDISAYSSDAQRAAMSSLTMEDGAPLPPYIANIAITVQPSLRVVEIPILTKTVTVADNPPNELSVTPAYTLGNTNRLAFDLDYQTFGPVPYPRAISEQDVRQAMDYIESHDMTAYQHIQKESVSPQRRVQIYRLDSKPSSFRDFDIVTPETISLAIDGSDFSYTTATFDDIVKSNHKYYYLFRVLNSNNVAGNVDTIICAELVNDGGYKYALFDTLFEEDLAEESYTDCTNQFNKILQLSPVLNQVTVDYAGADFEDTASSQYDIVNAGTAEELIWGKTFKIRLTSKKTGKKIDLNITYSDPDIKLEDNNED